MGFWGKNLRVPESELRASRPVQRPCFSSFRVLVVDLDRSKLILLMYLTVVKLSKPLETSNELD